MKIGEQADRWSVAVTCVEVDTLRFDRAVTVVLGMDDGRVEIRIEESFWLSDRTGARWKLDPEGDPPKLAPVLRLLRKEVVRVDAFTDGHLELEFVDGDLVTVPSSQRYEAWSIVSERGVRFVSTPGNGLAVWT